MKNHQIRDILVSGWNQNTALGVTQALFQKLRHQCLWMKRTEIQCESSMPELAHQIRTLQLYDISKKVVNICHIKCMAR